MCCTSKHFIEIFLERGKFPRFAKIKTRENLALYGILHCTNYTRAIASFVIKVGVIKVLDATSVSMRCSEVCLGHILKLDVQRLLQRSFLDQKHKLFVF